MPDWYFDVNSAAELDGKLREILFLDNVGRGDEIYGTVHISYSDRGVELASLISVLEARGVSFSWEHKP